MEGMKIADGVCIFWWPGREISGSP